MTETDCLKTDKDLLIKILIAARAPKFDHEEILHIVFHRSHPTWEIVTILCSLPTKLLCFITFKQRKIIKIPQNTAQILDGIARIQQFSDHLLATFVDLNIYIFRYLIKLFFFYMSSRVDFVCDEYNPLSIKDFKRRRRSISPWLSVARS